MDQNEINEAEWRDQANWSNARLGFYFSKNDTRTWVPKRNRATGWTLNVARSQGVYWTLGLLVAVPILAALFTVGTAMFHTGH
jgi:uncharacterized membrane protein